MLVLSEYEGRMRDFYVSCDNDSSGERMTEGNVSLNFMIQTSQIVKNMVFVSFENEKDGNSPECFPLSALYGSWRLNDFIVNLGRISKHLSTWFQTELVISWSLVFGCFLWAE